MTLVHLDVADGVAVMRLDNPPLNLFTHALTEQAWDVLANIEADGSIRCVVVTGSGSRAFSAGSDIKEFPRLMERGTVIEDKLALENAVFNRLAALPQPTIAAIEGVALGGGAEFALCCDYRIISETGSIGFPEIHIGTVPGSGGLSRLPRLINPSIAFALLIDGTPIDASRAEAIGLVDERAQPGGCVDAALARARQWAARPVIATRTIKSWLRRQAGDSAAVEVADSLEMSRMIYATRDMREGVAAFLEKRNPRFGHDE